TARSGDPSRQCDRLHQEGAAGAVRRGAAVVSAAALLPAFLERAYPEFMKPSLNAWRALIWAVFGLPLEADARALFETHTGRTEQPTHQAREAWLVIGRRGGKSRIASLLAVFLACVRDYRGLLAPGERGIVMLIAADRRQARVLKRYISALL